jgi:hypothetical protein
MKTLTMTEEKKQLWEKLLKACPKQYGWLFNERGFVDMNYDCNNPEGFGQFKPKTNWAVTWRDNVATILLHGGHIGRITKATFKF